MHSHIPAGHLPDGALPQGAVPTMPLASASANLALASKPHASASANFAFASVAPASASPSLGNPGMPRIREKGGLLFLAIRPNDRPTLATTIEALINLADAMDGDPDFEPALGGPVDPRLDELAIRLDDEREVDDSDFEPSGDELDASYPNDFLAVGGECHEDSEDDDPAGGDVQDEPHDAEPDLEWSLGRTEEINQANPHSFAHVGLGDGEQDGGDAPEDDGETFGSSGTGSEEARKLEETAEALILFQELPPEGKAVALEYARSLLEEQKGEARQ